MSDKEFNPKLNEAQLKVLKARGTEEVFQKNDTIIPHATKNYDFFVVLQGKVSILDPSNEFSLIASHSHREFIGDTDILSQRASLFKAVADVDTRCIRIGNRELKDIIAKYPDINDTLLKAFFQRRMELLDSSEGGLRVVGSRYSQETYRLRNFLSKNHVRYSFSDLEKDVGSQEILDHMGIPKKDVPILLDSKGQVFRNPEIDELADYLGIRSQWDQDTHDLLIVGAGPAGLAASVYAASEGLSVITIDAEGPGGQAGKSSKIENYLGFPTGLSGTELANRAYVQAQKFGCIISVPHRAKRLEFHTSHFSLETEEGKIIHASAVIIATGVSYRQLHLSNYEKFEGNGIYYDAGAMHADTCTDQLVGVVGGGNSAGQAALYLSNYAKKVHMILRSGDLGKSMSDYLVQRIRACENIEVHYGTEIVQLHGKDHLDELALEDVEGKKFSLKTQNLFIFIGAKPCTDWVRHLIATDEKGFVLTGKDIMASRLDKREPQSLETSVTGLFAVGDVRSGSSKRVASAVGEGSMAVGMVHNFLGKF